MNIVEFWRQQIAKWDEEKKCGLCWTFDAPMTDSAVELYQPPKGKECCVQALLTQDKVTPFASTLQYNSLTGFLNQRACNWTHQIYFVIPTELGVNNYTEIKGHTTDKARWVDVLQKLQECLACDAPLDFCEIMGTTYRVTQWSAVQVMNYTSANYTGYKLTVTFQTVN